MLKAVLLMLLPPCFYGDFIINQHIICVLSFLKTKHKYRNELCLLIMPVGNTAIKQNCAPEGAQEKCFPSPAFSRLMAARSLPQGMRKETETPFGKAFPARAFFVRSYSIFILTLCEHKRNSFLSHLALLCIIFVYFAVRARSFS